MMHSNSLLGDNVANEPLRIIKPKQHTTSEYSNLEMKFREATVDYNNQYCKLYINRLNTMLPLLQKRIEQKWSNKYPIIKLYKLQEEQSVKCIVVGTLFKEQKLKPSLLRKLSEANSLVPQPIHTHFTDDSDRLFIEDELQRYEVIGRLIDVHKYVTGVTCALLGIDQGLGKFEVQDYCFAECQPQIQRSLTQKEDRFVCFISGLNLINYSKIAMQLKLFIDWLTGFMDDSWNTQYVTRLIVAGSSIRNEYKTEHDQIRPNNIQQSNETLNAIQLLDTVLSQCVQFLDVDLMPGLYDPSNHLLAQQPMHRCLFPRASKYERFHSVTNPYQCEIDGLRFLGTSGQPVTDIMNYSRIERPIDALEQCLVWSHLAPTAPDTLAAYPYYNKDPFIIDECPHVLFTANHNQYDTKLYTGLDKQRVRLLCIPSFSETFSVVLLNVRTLDSQLMSFEADEL